MQTCWKRGLLRKVSWNLDSVLQLQRMAFEEADLETWENCGSDIPVTARGEKLPLATEWDEWHPSIKGKEVALEPSVHTGLIEGRLPYSVLVSSISTIDSSVV